MNEMHHFHFKLAVLLGTDIFAMISGMIPNEISPEYSLEGLMLKLKLQYFGHLMRRADSLEKTLMLRKIEDRRRGRQRMKWLDGMHHHIHGHEFEQTPGDNEGQGSLVCHSPWGCQESNTTE